MIPPSCPGLSMPLHISAEIMRLPDVEHESSVCICMRLKSHINRPRWAINGVVRAEVILMTHLRKCRKRQSHKSEVSRATGRPKSIPRYISSNIEIYRRILTQLSSANYRTVQNIVLKMPSFIHKPLKALHTPLIKPSSVKQALPLVGRSHSGLDARLTFHFNRMR
jgi:hypothetical protein